MKINILRKITKQNWTMITLAVTVAILSSAVTMGIVISNKKSSSTVANNIPTSSYQSSDPNGSSEYNEEKAQIDMLIYLIEEEKLAHDVYTVMYQTYGIRIFTNISRSEETHQAKVKTLLDATNIEDPRTSELGVFNNQELQSLYNTLIEQGKRSIEDAYRVGVAIEQKDIADIVYQLSTTNDTEITSILEILKFGSENHLNAFNRQLDRS